MVAGGVFNIEVFRGGTEVEVKTRHLLAKKGNVFGTSNQIRGNQAAGRFKSVQVQAIAELIEQSDNSGLKEHELYKTAMAIVEGE